MKIIATVAEALWGVALPLDHVGPLLALYARIVAETLLPPRR